MARRKLSEAYVNRMIAKIDALHERNQNIVPYPRCFDDSFDSVVFGRRSISSSDKKEIKAYYDQLRDLAIVSAFWYGWSLREGTPDA